MRRFSFDKMPLIFSTPRYFGHIPLLAVPGRTLQLVPCKRPRAVMTERRWATALSPSALNELRFACDVRIISAALVCLPAHTSVHKAGLRVFFTSQFYRVMDVTVGGYFAATGATALEFHGPWVRPSNIESTIGTSAI